jgi:hypothetical protein
MNKTLFAAASIATFALSTGAFAQDTDTWATKSGAFGIGADRMFGSSFPALSLRTFMGDSLGLELQLGADLSSRKVSPDEGDDITGSSSAFGIGLGGEFRIAESRKATLAAYLGLGIAMNGSNPANDTDDDKFSYMDFAAELGLRGEVFLYEFFSIYGRVGLTVDPEGDKELEGASGDNNNEDVKNSGMDIGLGGDLMGAFGFTFWLG